MEENYEGYGYNDWGNGGGTYLPPTPDKEEGCNDAKCPYCKKCLNPTKPNCTKCSCACTHEICKGCGLPIREGNGVQTRSSATCNKTHSAYCSSTGVVCDCGERHLDEITILPLCRKLEGTIISNTNNSGFSTMWNWSVQMKKECGGFVLNNGLLCLYPYVKNQWRNSSVGKLVSCTLSGKLYNIPIVNEIPNLKAEVEFISYAVAYSVHTHPEKDVQFNKIDSLYGLRAFELAVSSKDTLSISKFAFSEGLILSKNSENNIGYVFKYNKNSLISNSFCEIFGFFE